MHPQVLVVDDDPTFRSILSTAMRWAGYRVETTDDGGPALRLLRATPEPMVVTLDIGMRQHGGIEVLEAVAADEALARRHGLVVVTGAVGVAQHGRVRDLRDQLQVPLIEKPFDLRHLLDTVRQIEQRQSRR
jgi:CheY-like chemotaxis protein